MPRAIDFDQTFDLVLDCDKDKPEGERPAFVYRTLSVREYRALVRYMRDDSKASNDVIVDEATKHAATGLVGWKNQKAVTDGNGLVDVSFDPAELDRLITPLEAFELINKLISSCTSSPDDKKKSEPQPTSPTENSADTAQPSV